MKKSLKAFNGMFYLLDKRLESLVESIKDRDEINEEMSDKLTDIERKLDEVGGELVNKIDDFTEESLSHSRTQLELLMSIGKKLIGLKQYTLDDLRNCAVNFASFKENGYTGTFDEWINGKKTITETEKELPAHHNIKETINIKGEGPFIQVSGRGVSSVKDRMITDEQWDSMTDEQKRNRYIDFYNEFPEPMSKNLIEDFRNSNTSLPNPVDHADAVMGGIFWDDFDEFFYEQLLNYLCK